MPSPSVGYLCRPWEPERLPRRAMSTPAQRWSRRPLGCAGAWGRQRNLFPRQTADLGWPLGLQPGGVVAGCLTPAGHPLWSATPLCQSRLLPQLLHEKHSRTSSGFSFTCSSWPTFSAPVHNSSLELLSKITSPPPSSCLTSSPARCSRPPAQPFQ